jgi:hypothetical protein
MLAEYMSFFRICVVKAERWTVGHVNEYMKTMSF